MKISDALMNAAAGCIVRECDEEQPGRFVAYVDEGDESYDAVLELNAEAQPEKGSCDCPARKPCKHLAALYLFVSKGNTVAAPIVAPAQAKSRRAKAKVSPAEVLLEKIALPELSAWLLQVFTANKDLELSFVNRFSAGEDLEPGEVVRLSENAVKTVMGRKRIPDSTQITKLLQLWKELHNPIVERYRAAPASGEAYEALAAAADAVMDFANAHAGTVKLQKYARQLLSGFATQVSLLKQDEAFCQAAGFPISHLLRQTHSNRGISIEYLDSLVELVIGPRLAWLAETIGTQFLLHRDSKNLKGDLAYLKMVLKTVRKAGVFAGYADAFTTLSWMPDFNIPLIDAWIEAGMYDVAEAAARNEIGRNTKDIHNPPYYEALQRLYSISGNVEGLSRLLRERLPETFDFDDYLVALKAIPDTSERRDFRNMMYTRARNVKSPAANAFAMRLTFHEGNWERVLEMIARDELDYANINRFFDQLVAHSGEKLIRALMQRRDWNALYQKDQEGLKESVGHVVRNVMDNYDLNELRLAVTRFSISYQHSSALNMFRPLITAALAEAAAK